MLDTAKYSLKLVSWLVDKTGIGEQVVKKVFEQEAGNEVELVKQIMDINGCEEEVANYLSENGFGDMFTEYEDPVKDVVQLPDQSDMVYVWLMPDADEDRQDYFAAEFKSEFRETHNRDPESMHLFMDSIDDVNKLPVEDFKEHLEPWMLNRLEDKLK